jgi:hypothetical protein
MTSRQRVIATIERTRPDKLARSFPAPWESDFAATGPRPSPDARHSNGADEWGCVWENIGAGNLGEVKLYPLDSWDKWNSLAIPDIRAPHRWQRIEADRTAAGERFLYGSGVALYERAHFLRGLENIWMDIYDEPEKLGALIDLLADMNVALIEKYAENSVDAIFLCDDWGLQDRLMIRPQSWYEIWQPRYARVFGAAHARGLKTILHSCGYILDILPGLIDAGLDVIQMDQQMNMGLDKLSRFRGRLTFFCPVDIQAVMPRNDLAEIRRYCRGLAGAFAVPEGGFIADWYGDPAAVGHSPEAIEAMCDEFGRISREIYGR